MTAIQATLGQFFSSRRPISWWLHHLRAMPPIPFARREPIVVPLGHALSIVDPRMGRDHPRPSLSPEERRARKQAYDRGYYHANREKILARQKGYDKTNRERITARERKRRARA